MKYPAIFSDSTQRKLKKLQRDPEHFFKDMLFKRREQIKQHVPLKYYGETQFTIVTAIYNVSLYLDDFFESIVSQSYDFKKHIQIICVDDGSTDKSAEIIKKWQKKYPKNIQYIYKENGGQASARNLGIQYVKTEWVTFIDSDDMISKDYCYEVDQLIQKHQHDLALISCPFIFYFEDTGLTKDSHPLKYRFGKSASIVRSNDLKENLQLSVNSAFFKANILKNNNIFFDNRIKPSFEDAQFVANYLMHTTNQRVIFASKNIHYLYRKRADASSTLDTSWSKSTLFTDVLEHGCLNILLKAKQVYGKVPKHIQRTVLYHYIWYIKRIINNEASISHLSEDQKHHFLSLSHQIFQYIDKQTIMDFNLGGSWFFHKVGMLGYFKKENPDFQVAYIESIDREKKQALIYYFSYFDADIRYQVNGLDSLPIHHKNTSHSFLDDTFVYERRAWIQFDKAQDRLRLFINNQATRITLAGKPYKNGVTYQEILDAFKPSAKYNNDDSWVLMDRDTQADDNAEHLYRYIQLNHPEKKIIFALRQSSNDWNRLQKDGFNLVDFGSFEFENKLRRCSKIISSHLDQYIYDYFNDEYEYSKKFVFLQHGITQNNISQWFNAKKNLRILVATTQNEYSSFLQDNSPYRLSTKDVILSGLPRHDALIQNSFDDQKILLIMPTWRKNIVGSAIGKGNTRGINKQFIQSEYAKHWSAFLQSSELRDITRNLNFKIIFAPHTNILPYLEMLKVPKYIEVWQPNNDSSMQSLFQQVKVMITDYSSVAFEMGYLNKLVLYYQFDRDQVYSGTHITQLGYFDFERDGFGPVATTEPQLLKALEKVLQNNGRPNRTYLKRMKETFPFRDGKNCERVYQAILELDAPEKKNVDLLILRKYLHDAALVEDWQLLKSRSLLLLEHGQPSDFPLAQYHLAKAIIHLGETRQWKALTSAYVTDLDWQILEEAQQQNWDTVFNLFNQKTAFNIEDKLLYIQTALHTQQFNDRAIQFVDELKNEATLAISQKVMINIWLNQAQMNWRTVKDILLEAQKSDATFANIGWKKFKPQIILTQAYAHLGDLDEAEHWLTNYRQLYGRDVNYYIDRMNLAYMKSSSNLAS